LFFLQRGMASTTLEEEESTCQQNIFLSRVVSYHP